GGREVKVVVSRGINDLGIEVYLIRDIQDDGTSYYTHSLYNYSDASPWGNHANIPTWEEFSVFYSKAALKFIERQENKERKTDLKWKAPVVHLNDSQVALVSVYAKIELDKEIEKAEKDNSYIVNPVLDDMVMCFTTHTYANRKEYSLEGGANDYSEGIMSFMDIPSKYRGLFVNYKQGGYRYDMASGGLRTADWQGAVARAHRDDVAIWDEWINDPYNDIANQLKAQVNGYDIEVNVTAVSNGDHRALTARYFRDILNKLFGSQVDVEQPTGEQIFGEKREAKKQLKLAKGTFYSTHDFEVDEEGMCTILDPNQMVITYSGRGVPEKVGMGMDFREYIVTGTDGRGAFDHYAIEEALKRGAQIVLYANVQTKHELSRRIQKDMIKFIDDMRSMKYPGRCIFVPRFSQDDQRKLLAASDVQVQDSYPKSEAAGFTECDMADCGGIEVCTLRTDNNGVGEGLLQAQGMLMDLGRLGELSIEELDQLTDEQILEYLGDAPGRGNTILPKELSAKGYLHAYVILLKIYQVKQLKAYQATSVRLSRVLDARLTSAEYLRQFSYAVSRKETKKKIGEKIKELEDMQRARKTLLAQLFTNQKDEPRGYAIRNIAKDVLYGQIESALMLFFTSASFQGADENLSTVAEIFDKLIEAYKGDKATGEYIIRFLKAVIAQSVNMAEEDENQKKVSQNLQVLAGQTLTIISWMKDGVPEAENMRVSAEENKMIANDKYGKGFISIDTNALPVGLSHTQKEGKIGLFWRGIEKIKKLADNICKLLMIDDNIFKKAKEKVVMYLMDHGFIKVPHGLRKATDDGDVSTIHYTAFINDKLPGFVQTTSTGAGHFQADKLDIKYVPEGKGIQVCVRYDMSGNIVDKKCFEVEAGDWCVALPGYVDYFINKGGLRFYDFSIKLSPEMAKKFNPHMDFTPENIAAMKKVVEEHARAPYLGALIGGQSFIVKTRPEDDNNTEWLSLTEEILPELAANYSLVKIYAEQLTSMEKLNAFVEGFADAYNKSLVSPKKGPSSPLIIEDEAKKMIDSEQPVPDKGYMDKVEGVLAFLDDNGTFIKELFDEKTGQDKLIRVSVESISSIGKENVVGFLQAIQTGRGYVELFSTENPGEISENVYKNMGLVKKALPASLQEGNRSKSNTITIFPVFKGESLPESLVNARWGVVKPGETIIAPVGFNYDAAGLARSVMLGFRLSEIARKNLDSDSHFVEYTLAQYMDLCLSQGETAENFDLTKEDIVNIALGNIDVMVRSLNKLIRLLPIMPINVEQLHEIYERAREIAIRA
ncbi:MAG TPA: hypothetical protein PKG81_05355, partial [Candidatus Omnitrophota bacterium]|nr:hypothetical protein [Candidatus Omnitrophota bacterium]